MKYKSKILLHKVIIRTQLFPDEPIVGCIVDSDTYRIVRHTNIGLEGNS